MSHLSTSKSKTTDTSSKKTKKREQFTIDVSQHETLEDALRDPKVSNQLSLKFKYSDYLRNLEEILDVIRNNKVSPEEAEYILPIKKALYNYSFSLYETHIKSDKVISELKNSHQAECADLRIRILELEAQVSNLKNLLTFGENAFLLEDSCNAPQKKLMLRIRGKIAEIESDVAAWNGGRIDLGWAKDDKDDSYYLRVLIAAIKDRFGPEGWEIEIENVSEGGMHFFLAPQKEVYLAMGVTEGSELIALKSKKVSLWVRFRNWLADI